MCLSLKCAELALKQAAQPVYVGPNPDAFTVVMAECDEAMQKLLRQLLANGSVANWGAAMEQLLLDYHAQSHLVGQDKWGVQSMMMAEGRARRAVIFGNNPEADYLAGFIRDLIAKDPRYFDEDGTPKEDRILQRMRMYQGKMRGTEGWGVLDVSPPNQLWKWHLGGTEEHCEDCPYLASLIAVTKDEWYTTPGNGDTPCLGNCKCVLVAEGNSISTAEPIIRLAA